MQISSLKKKSSQKWDKDGLSPNAPIVPLGSLLPWGEQASSQGNPKIYKLKWECFFSMFPPPIRSQGRLWSQIQGWISWFLKGGLYMNWIQREDGLGGWILQGTKPSDQLLTKGKSGMWPSCNRQHFQTHAHMQLIFSMEQNVPFPPFNYQPVQQNGAIEKWC